MICYTFTSLCIGNTMKRHFTAKDIALYYGMNEKTAQKWARSTGWRVKVYDALQNQMLQDMAEMSKKI